MAQELWQKHAPVGGIAEGTPYMMASFYEDTSGITLTLRRDNYRADKSTKLKIFFKGPIILYRKTNDSLSVLAVNAGNVDYGPDIGKAVFYKVTNSQLIARIRQSSLCAELLKINLMHFVLYEIDSEVVVIVMHEPQVEWIELESL